MLGMLRGCSAWKSFLQQTPLKLIKGNLNKLFATILSNYRLSLQHRVGKVVVAHLQSFSVGDDDQSLNLVAIDILGGLPK